MTSRDGASDGVRPERAMREAIGTDEPRPEVTLERIAAAFEPIRSWYDGDGRETDLAAMIAAAAIDLERDRKELLAVYAEGQRQPGTGFTTPDGDEHWGIEAYTRAMEWGIAKGRALEVEEHAVDRARIIDALDQTIDDLHALAEEIEPTRSTWPTSPEILDLLRQIEWSANGPHGQQCPLCLRLEHRADCKLKVVLSRLQGEQSAEADSTG